MKDPDVPGRFTAGQYVVDVEDDRSLTLWSTETGDAFAVPQGDGREVITLLCEAYVNSGRFPDDKARKAFAEAVQA